MKLLVCDAVPYLNALEGLRHVLRESFRDVSAEQIGINGMEPVYDEESLERKVSRLGSGRCFLRHVRKLARTVNAPVEKLGWNQFLLRDVNGTKVFVGQIDEVGQIVVAFEGTAEFGFVGIMTAGRRDFEDVCSYPVHRNEFFAKRDRQMLMKVCQIMAS